jgi:hypothetical protein
MSNRHDYSHAKRHMRLSMLFLFSIAMIATGMVASIPDAEARGGGGAARAGGGGGAARAGGGGGGRRAQSSVSGVNHAATRPSGGGGNHAATRPSGGGGNRGNGNAGNINKGNINTGNVNTGNINRGNVNTGNINVGNDINIDIDGGYGYGHGGYYHPIATGVAIGAVAVTTAAVMGSYYYALPPSGCTNVVRNGIPYYYCGSVYYQQTWSGNDVVYVVVNP